MVDYASDSVKWTKEKLLQASGDYDFLVEKVTKWRQFGYFWEHHAEKVGVYLTDSIQEKMNRGTTIEEWLNTIYSPLEATILAAAFVTFEWVDPLINGANFYHEERIDNAISLIDIKQTKPDGVDGTFADICEPDTRLFPHDVTLLDIINILDREVAERLYEKGD